MTEWYIPITILPGIGLLIMSTTGLANALNAELMQMMKEESVEFKDIIQLKISQLGLLSRSLVGFYISSGIFVFSGLIGGVSDSVSNDIEKVISGMMLLGILVVFYALVLLIIYALKAVKIKKNHFERRLKLRGAIN